MKLRKNLKSLHNTIHKSKVSKILFYIFYECFIFIIFIILILLIIKFLYKYISNYIKNYLFYQKLTDIYFDIHNESTFNYNFCKDDFVIIDNEQKKKLIINYTKLEDNLLILKMKDEFSKETILKINLDNYVILNENDIEIKNFKYISNKPYHINFDMDYHYIEPSKNNIELTNLLRDENTNIIDSIYNIKSLISVETLNKLKDYLINLLYFNQKKTDIKLKYKGSNIVNNLEDLPDRLFRGNLFSYQDDIYFNEYEMIHKNFNNLEENNIYNVINRCNQYNFFSIMTNICTNKYKFKDYEIIKKFLSLLYPSASLFFEEVIYLMINNNDIYISSKVKKSKYKNNRLLLLNFNIILYILNNSVHSFIRLLYNYYDGICCFYNDKLLYVKLLNKKEKKNFYNKI